MYTSISPPSTLREKLIKAQEPSGSDSIRLFLPKDRLTEILSDDNIEKELKEQGIVPSDPLKSFHSNRRKENFRDLGIFGIDEKNIRFRNVGVPRRASSNRF